MQDAGTTRTADTSASLPVLAALLVVYSAGAALQRPESFGGLLLEYLHLATRAAFIVVAAGLFVILLARSRGDFRQLLGRLARRCAFGVAATVLFAAVLAAFSTYKVLIPSLLPFVWDAPFDALDRLVHGRAPWELTHAVLPTGLADLIGALYGIPWFLYWFGTLGYVVFCLAGPLRSRYLWGMALTITLMGTLAATVFSSHGPIFFPHFGLDGYGGLAAALRETELGRGMLQSADYLYAAHAAGEARFGSGISAMPSMHVAIAVLNLCFFAALDRRLAIAALFFAGAIVLGSVHFGWHYAVDSYASMAAVPMLWWLAGRLEGAGRPAPLLARQPQA